jgi:hypothetical protein
MSANLPIVDATDYVDVDSDDVYPNARGEYTQRYNLRQFKRTGFDKSCSCWDMCLHIRTKMAHDHMTNVIRRATAGPRCRYKLPPLFPVHLYGQLLIHLRELTLHWRTIEGGQYDPFSRIPETVSLKISAVVDMLNTHLLRKHRQCQTIRRLRSVCLRLLLLIQDWPLKEPVECGEWARCFNVVSNYYS